ncbi:MAG: S-layer homology domain-containing protein [Clostridia bacterium]|nr:S-layer homology domain-containing protein [Clostridia bacterium]
MKNLKRLIALVAVFALALTTIASAASFTDVADDSAYFKAVEQLHKIGIIDGYTDGTFGPEKTVTRSEMAKLIAAMQGYAESASGKAVTKFSDVPSTHWASGYIAAATGVAIDGRPDGTFAPEEEVKYEDAVKMIMATLGYTVVANANGGYPMGYVSAAIKEGVTEDVVKAAVGTPASRGTIAQLLYNAIDTPLVEQITWNLDGSGDFIKYDGESKYGGQDVEYKTLMTENLGIVKGEAVVTDTSYFGLTEVAAIDKEEPLTVNLAVAKVWGDDEDFEETGILVADSGAENYVGKAVEFFAFQDKYDDWTLLSVIADENYNKAVTFDIMSYDDAKASDDNLVYYYKDGAKTSTKLALQAADSETGAADFKAMYNFEAVDLATDSVHDIIGALKAAKVSGAVTLIDNDKFAGYDAVIIEAAASAVVDEINDGVIIFKAAVTEAFETTSIDQLDTDDDALVIKFVKDGAEVAADAVAEGDVLSLIFMDDEGYIVADIMSNIVEGAITSRKSSDLSADGFAYKVDGKWYDTAIDTLGVEVGDAAKFYIDKFGRIAYADETVAVSGNYAYIYGAYFEKAEAGSYKANEYTLQLLTKDGVKEYPVASKFTVAYLDTTPDPDVTVEKEYEVKNMVDATPGAGQVLASAVTTIIDNKLADITFSNGAVKKIILENADDEILKKENSLTGKYVAEDLEIGTVGCDEDTVVFFIEEEVTGSVIDKDASYVGTLADIEDGANVTTGAYYSNKKTNDDANVLVIVGLGTKINAASGLAVITDVVDATNADEEDIYELTVLYNGEEVALTTTADIYAGAYDPEIGDIVKIKVNGNKVVTKLEVVADDVNNRANGAAIATTLEETGEYADQAGEKIVAGYASAINKTSKKITVGEAYNLNKFDNIYVIDNTGRKLEVKKGSAASYKFDDRLFDTVGYGSKNIEVDDAVIGTVSAKANNVADYVIIRTYEGSDDVYEMVIIKGVDYKIK